MQSEWLCKPGLPAQPVADSACVPQKASLDHLLHADTFQLIFPWNLG